MPRYFLHVRDPQGGAEDDEGVEVASLAEATQWAIAGIRSMLIDAIRSGVLNLDGRVEIADDIGRVLTAVRFADAVRITGRSRLHKGPRTADKPRRRAYI